jgi:signal transduction histidine kinase/ActR/RegA family two-component response regulator
MQQLNWRELEVPNPAPVYDWSHMTQAQHFAQVYETDQFLLNSLAGFVTSGLAAGETVIVVATKDHLDQLEPLLQKNLDLSEARASGRFVAMDAAETLALLMANGSLDAELFNKTVSSHVGNARKEKRSVRVFGEMVALLWQRRDFEGAIRLEELWNQLHREDPFLLFCAYPGSGFVGDEASTPFRRVCSEHTCVIPAESYTILTSPEARLQAILDLQQKANSLQAEIAERKQAEDVLRTVRGELKQQLVIREELLVREQMARAEAEHASRMKDEFLATVSHELRTPLNAIIGWCHMIRTRRLDDSTFDRALETIDRNAKAQAQLIEDILDVSRVITGKLQLKMGPVDLATVINAAIDSVQPAAESKGIQLAITLDPSARHALGDANRLQQVVWNLLSNAIKFTPATGLVQVKLARLEDTLQIWISDSGQGIRAEFLPFLFERFRQADGTITRKHGGLGLGLAIVRHLVELHGGTVHADSPGEGLGATFTVKLPLAPQSKSDLARSTEAESLYGLNGGTASSDAQLSLAEVRVLVVENDEDTLQMLSVMLQERSAIVEAAGTVAKAMEILQWFNPDVIVSDLAMPDEDGYSLIRSIRSAEAESVRQIPAVALTAYVRIEDRAQALSAGFNMFVPKPVEPNELIIAIANLVESHHR